MRKTCPDCGAPVYDNMVPAEHGCWFWGQYEARMRSEGYSETAVQEARASGADAPCAGNEYNYDHQQGARLIRAKIGFCLGLLVITLLSMWYWG